MILGYDPGLAASGAVVYNPSSGKFVDAKAIKTKKQIGPRKGYAADEFVRRCREVVYALSELCAKWGVHAVCSEASSWPMHGVGQRSIAAGVAVSVAVSTMYSDAPVYTMQPQAIKKVLCGKVSASKEEVEAYMRQHHPELIDMITGDKKVRSDQWDAAAAVAAAMTVPELRVLMGG